MYRSIDDPEMAANLSLPRSRHRLLLSILVVRVWDVLDRHTVVPRFPSLPHERQISTPPSMHVRRGGCGEEDNRTESCRML